MTLGHGWLCNEANEAGSHNYCDAWAANYNYERIELLATFIPESPEYRKYFN